MDIWSFPGVVVVAFPSLRWNPDFSAYGFLLSFTDVRDMASNEWVTHNPREHTLGPLGFQACVPEYDYAGEIRQPSGVPTQFGCGGCFWTNSGGCKSRRCMRKPPWFLKNRCKPVNNRNFKWWVNFSGLFQGVSRLVKCFLFKQIFYTCLLLSNC